MTSTYEPIERQDYDSQWLMSEHPPRWRHLNKEVVFEIACPPGTAHHSRLTYTRWAAMELPQNVEVGEIRSMVVVSQNHYNYAPVDPDGSAVEWHVNFADPRLFVAYASRLLAQDEIQVAEHPILGALKEALDSEGTTTRTADDYGPTPVLIRGAERRCRISTRSNPEQGRPKGLYGNAFARATEEAVRLATTRIDPPTITNLIAIAALPGGFGEYGDDEIEYILTTAYTGFKAAVLESQELDGTDHATIVHTGFWGCGAFGGNRVLMAMLQILAGQMAGLHRLVFHTFNARGSAVLEKALDTVESELATDGSLLNVETMIDQIEAMGFEWGVSDGN